MKIKNEYIYFLYFMVTKPYKDFRVFYSGVKQEVSSWKLLLNKLNYPKIWMWVTIFLLVLYLLFYGSFHRFLVAFLLTTIIWSEWNRGYWKYEYRQQFKEEHAEADAY